MKFSRFRLAAVVTAAAPLAHAVFATTMIAGSAALAQGTPTYSADVPAKITTPDSTDTRIGTLNFKDGAPDGKTVDLVYDNLDFMRGVQSFLTGISATSIRAACNGFETIGIKTNEAFGITEQLHGCQIPVPHAEHHHGLRLHLFRPVRGSDGAWRCRPACSAPSMMRISAGSTISA